MKVRSTGNKVAVIFICMTDMNENSFATSDILFPAKYSKDILRPIETKNAVKIKLKVGIIQKRIIQDNLFKA